jgi:hypothetical protein
LEYWKGFHERVPIMAAFVRRILPPAGMILGMVVITAWVSLLAYGIATLVEALWVSSAPAPGRSAEGQKWLYSGPEVVVEDASGSGGVSTAV